MSRNSRSGRLVATIAALGVVLAAPAAVGFGEVSTAHAATPESFNPFVAAGGYSIYARGDADLGGSETEGAVAVGGTFSVRAGSTYPVIHFTAGTADYEIPTVDGDPTRLLIGSYDASSDGRVQISNAGSGGDPARDGILKVVDGDPAFGYFERGGFTRYRLSAAGADDPPLIDVAALPFVSAAESEAAITTELPAVADYVEADMTWTYDEAAQCLADVADPANGLAAFPTILEESGGRLVLTGVATDRPNVVTYEDRGAIQVQFEPFVQLGPTNPLIVRVPAGTTVIKAPFGAEGATKNYIFYDLSAVTGAVTIESAVGEGRIDGSIYAPNVDLTVGGSPLDGQVISDDLATSLGSGETHAYFFKGEVPCATTPGSSTFTIEKTLSGAAAGLVPDGTVFVVDYVRDGVDAGSLVIPFGQTVVIADLPPGTVIALTEVEYPDIDGVVWGTPTWTVDGVVLEPDADGTVSFTVGESSMVSIELDNFANAPTTPPTTPPETPAPPAGGGGELAESGIETGVWSVLGGGALLLGVLLAAAARRRRVERG
ncbi:collagen-binding domain-containing protein [Agromyces sp. NPDC057679]|uniref:collagen-binding domain-containing protein n=1 Tax=Agromyces sp. NPDC057679 TaxID=3346207 RepID=UPI00366B611C